MPHKSTVGRLTALLSVAVLLCTACKQQSPEEQLKAYNQRLGSQGELTSTHLIVRWPGLGADKRPMTLKVPREYLFQDKPVVLNEAGEIEKIYITVAMPEATAWQPLTPRVGNDDPPERRALWEQHTRKRKFVIVTRELRGGLAWRDSIRRASQGAEGDIANGRHPDGVLAGLERFSPIECRQEPNNHVSQEFIDAKSADDSSPSNCRRNRAWAHLVSPPQVSADNEGVGVRCMSTGCHVYFVSGRLGTNIDLSHADLSRWQDFVEPIRKRIDGFAME
jgi:hypothetical protein